MSTDPDHRRPKKNGHDQTQDREIRELHEDFRKHVKHENDMHAGLYDKAVETSHAVDLVGAKLDKYVFAGRIVHAAIALLASGILIYQAALHSRLGSMQAQIDEVDRRVEAWIPFATKWGDELEEQDKNNADKIRELRHEVKDLRRTINGRQ